jgi:hypothetical protein
MPQTAYWRYRLENKSSLIAIGEVAAGPSMLTTDKGRVTPGVTHFGCNTRFA